MKAIDRAPHVIGLECYSVTFVDNHVHKCLKVNSVKSILVFKT